MVDVRQVEMADLPGVGQLYETVDWPPPTVDSWRRIWDENPAFSPSVARGWVLSDGDQIVGFLGNLQRQFRFGGRDLLAAVACSLVVAPAYRGHSLRLAAQFSKQPNVDILMTTTAASQTTKIFEFLKFARMPQPEYDLSLYWILRTRPFVASVMRKKGMSEFSSHILGVTFAFPLWIWLNCSGRRLCTKQPVTTFVAEEDSTPEINQLWQRANRSSRLMAIRDFRTLGWQFKVGKRTTTKLICARRNGRVCGYLALVPRHNKHIGLRRYIVGDLFVDGDSPQITSELLSAAARIATKQGASMLMIDGFPREIRDALRAHRPLSLLNDAWPYLYRAQPNTLHDALSNPDAWYAGPYDGDGSL